MIPTRFPPLEERPAPGPGLLSDVGRLLEALWRRVADLVLPPSVIRRAGIGETEGDLREYLRKLLTRPGWLR